MALEIDLLGDYRRILLEKLKQRGVDAEGWPVKECFTALFDNDSRQVPQKKYTVHVSAELSDKLKAGQYYAEYLDNVIACFEEGRPITPFLSTFVAKPEAEDAMLIHWGLNHLHVVPPNMRADGFYARKPTRWLFFKVKNSDVYFVDVRPHENPEMCDTELLAIMSRNWPDLLAHTATAGEGECLTPQQVKRLREQHVGHIVTTELGDVRQENLPTCGGRSARAGKTFDQLADELEQWQRYLLDKYSVHIPKDVSRLTLVDVEDSPDWVVEGRGGSVLFRVTLDSARKWRFLT